MANDIEEVMWLLACLYLCALNQKECNGLAIAETTSFYE
jgi:hypothetical protein